MNASFVISSVLGLTAGWLVSRRTRQADVETASLSIAPKPQSPVYGRFYVIPPERWPSLAPEMIAALWRVGEIPPEAMPGLAADLLLRGFDGKWLRRCAGEIRPVRADIDNFDYLLFRELGVHDIFSEDQARDKVGLFLAREIYESRMDPFEGVARIEALFDWDLPSNCKFQRLVDLSMQHEFEIAMNEQDLKRSIRDACSELIKETDE